MSDVQEAMTKYELDELADDMAPDIEAAVPMADDIPDDADDEHEETAKPEPEKPFAGSLTLKDGKSLSFDDIDPDSVVTLPGGQQMTFADWKKGGLLHADYTHKTQVLSAQRKQADQHTAVNQQWSKAALNLAASAMLVLDKSMPKKPDIQLAQSDSHAYLVAKDAHERGQEMVKQLGAQAAQVLQWCAIKTSEDVQARHRHARAQLEQRYPYLRDERAFKNALTKAGDTLARYNIDINEVPPDARYYALVHDHEKMLNNPKYRDNLRDRPAPRVQQPGARRSANFNGEAKAKREAWTRLRHGDSKAGVELIEDILGNG